MTEIKETMVTTQEGAASTGNNDTVVSSAPAKATTSQTTEYLIYFFFGVLEFFLAFRLILKVMGASMASGFVSFIYGLSGIFILPFEGIFRRSISQGIETSSVLEPATLVAIVVYAFVAWGIVVLTRVLSREQQA